MTNGQNNPSSGAQYPTLLILWVAMLSFTLMYLVVTLILPRSSGPENHLLTIIFSAVSAFLVVVSFAVKGKVLARSVEAQDTRLVKTGIVLALALCEGAAILGLLDFLVARDRYYVVLIIFSFMGMVLHFPRRSQLVAASGG
ncbi:MAG TPA: hypothetical protein VGN90_04080 [Pyrinomonadaceae bacterium]|jgi:hypothetical protein|nr:hypothetical protein [Pyrinomonadaceae bacterium]